MFMTRSTFFCAMKVDALGSASSIGQWSSLVLTPLASRNLAVPPVAKSSKPIFSSLCTVGRRYCLVLGGPVERRIECLGRLKPAAKSDLRKASSNDSPKDATSPVETMSTLVTGSAPSSLMNENCGDLTANLLGSASPSGTFSPKKTPADISIRLTPTLLDTKGML